MCAQGKVKIHRLIVLEEEAGYVHSANGNKHEISNLLYQKQLTVRVRLLPEAVRYIYENISLGDPFLPEGTRRMPMGTQRMGIYEKEYV